MGILWGDDLADSGCAVSVVVSEFGPECASANDAALAVFEVACPIFYSVESAGFG